MTNTNAGKDIVLPHKYRKKPIVVEAVQMTEEMWRSNNPPEGVVCTCVGGENWKTPLGYSIRTKEGDMVVRIDDWIITGIKGEKYPCKPDIFEATYEAAEQKAVPGDDLNYMLEDVALAIARADIEFKTMAEIPHWSRHMAKAALSTIRQHLSGDKLTPSN